MLQAICRPGPAPGHFLQAIHFDDEHRDLISMTPDNQPPAESSYVCFVSMLDYWRAYPDRCLLADVAHFSESLEPPLIADIQLGRALLVFDLSNEGPPFYPSMFDAIHSFLDSRSIPCSHATWMCQNRAMRSAYEAYYRDKREEFLVFDCYDFYVKLVAHWFADSNWREGLTGETDAYCVALHDPLRKTRFALCMNASPHLHRIYTVAALHHFRVMPHCLVSFHGLKHPDGRSVDRDWVLSMLDDWNLPFLRDACAEIIEMGPMRIDNFRDRGFNLVDKIDIRSYLATCFSIITESDFSAGTIDRITEKTTKVFCLGHPCLIIGNPGALRVVADLGFQLFSSALRDGYDDIIPPSVRFAAVFAECLAHIVDIQKDPVSWIGRTTEVSRFNVAYAAGGLLRHYKDRYDKRVIARLEQRLALGPSVAASKGGGVCTRSS